MEAENGRRCALCHDPIPRPPFLVHFSCSACNRRAYCSLKCQKEDWCPEGAGQGHKDWCGLGVGEEGVDWAVRHISDEKEKGVVALHTLPAGSRIMVGRPCPHQSPHVPLLSRWRDAPCPGAPILAHLARLPRSPVT